MKTAALFAQAIPAVSDCRRSQSGVDVNCIVSHRGIGDELAHRGGRGRVTVSERRSMGDMIEVRKR